MLRYPDTAETQRLIRQLELYAQMQTEFGARGVSQILRRFQRQARDALHEMRRLRLDAGLARREPGTLDAIRALRPRGPRRMWTSLDIPSYRERVEGALLARFAGCTLGAPVEGWSIARMQALARANGQSFPPEDYWETVPDPEEKRYGLSRRSAYTRRGMKGVPVDDDIAYTLLGLLIVEEAGPGFTTDDVGAAWLRYLPYACTAEEVALRNLREGVPACRAGQIDNPYCQWIGADIRADPWGYLAPGWPERAAELAYRDAFLSHRRQGIYGAMFFAAAISAAFAVEDPVEALHIGLSEIPRDCGLARALRWALKEAPRISDHAAARAAVDERFAGMHPVHTVNNACLTIWGVTLGGRDVTRVLGETVAMGLDNDCTAATAGSLVGAVVGRTGVPDHWHRPFRNTVHTYLIGKRSMRISGLVRRFTRQARRMYAPE